MANKISTERTHKALIELVTQAGNDVCADCKSRNPRWASHNLGVFLCVNCASIHRKIGSHITKVKSLTMDTWTKDQVDHMRRNGNVKSNLYYCPNVAKYPPPTNMLESERDSELEKYIRAKYEAKRFVDKSAFVASQLGPSRSAASLSAERQQRPQSTPLGETSHNSVKSALPVNSPNVSRPARSVSQPLQQLSPSTLVSDSFTRQPQHSQTLPTMPSSSQATNPVWADLVSLRQPAAQATLPLQYQAPLGITSSMNAQGFGQFEGQVPQNTHTASLAIPAAPNPFHQLQHQQQVQYIPPSQPYISTAPAPSINATSALPNPQFIQPQATSFGQQYFSQMPMQTPSPQPFANPTLITQNGFLSPSPHPQTPFGPDVLRSTPSPFMQPVPSPSHFTQSYQSQPQFIQPGQAPFTFQQPPQAHFQQPQQDQFTSWLSKGPGSGMGQH